LLKEVLMSWTDERIALLKKMWKEGKSAADIAKTLAKGVTRNAVIGKAHRMGLSNRPSPIKKGEKDDAPAPVKQIAKKDPPKKDPPKKEVAAKPAAKKLVPPVVVSGVKHNPLAREIAEPRKFEKEAIPEGGGVALIDLTERMCRWPIGDPREDDFTFCGRGIRAGTPYCPDHAGAAYQSSSRSRAAAAAEEKEVKEVAVVDDTTDDDEVGAVT
jgi:GcrA cell cycle regulator